MKELTQSRKVAKTQEYSPFALFRFFAFALKGFPVFAVLLFSGCATTPTHHVALTGDILEDGPKMIAEGWLSLQAESHPVEFRRVELMRLSE